MIIGDYRYGGCIIDGVRYAVVKNYGVVERILITNRQDEKGMNVLVWSEGDPLTPEIVRIMAEADFTPPPLPPDFLGDKDG